MSGPFRVLVRRGLDPRLAMGRNGTENKAAALMRIGRGPCLLDGEGGGVGIMEGMKLHRVLRSGLPLAVLFSVVSLAGCATGTALSTAPVAGDEEIPGLFTAIFFGRHYAEEVDAIVVLDLEGDEYRFAPEAKRKDFEVLVSISAAEALYEARPFFNLHEAFAGQVRLLRIQSPEGRAIGYEVRPLYDPVYFGAADVVKSEYRLAEGGTVLFKSEPRSRVGIMLSPGAR